MDPPSPDYENDKRFKARYDEIRSELEANLGLAASPKDGSSVVEGPILGYSFKTSSEGSGEEEDDADMDYSADTYANRPGKTEEDAARARSVEELFTWVPRPPGIRECLVPGSSSSESPMTPLYRESGPMQLDPVWRVARGVGVQNQYGSNMDPIWDERSMPPPARIGSFAMTPDHYHRFHRFSMSPEPSERDVGICFLHTPGCECRSLLLDGLGSQRGSGRASMWKGAYDLGLMENPTRPPGYVCAERDPSKHIRVKASSLHGFVTPLLPADTINRPFFVAEAGFSGITNGNAPDLDLHLSLPRRVNQPLPKSPAIASGSGIIPDREPISTETDDIEVEIGSAIENWAPEPGDIIILASCRYDIPWPGFNGKVEIYADDQHFGPHRPTRRYRQDWACFFEEGDIIVRFGSFSRSWRWTQDPHVRVYQHREGKHYLVARQTKQQLYPLEHKFVDPLEKHVHTKDFRLRPRRGDFIINRGIKYPLVWYIYWWDEGMPVRTNDILLRAGYGEDDRLSYCDAEVYLRNPDPDFLKTWVFLGKDDYCFSK